MTRSEEVYGELCPRRAAFRAVGEVAAKSSSIKWPSMIGRTFEYIDLTSVDRGAHSIGTTATIDAGNAPSRAKQIVHAGDVIFATTRPAQMRWAVIPAQYDGQIASTGYCVLRPRESLVLTKFLAHVLDSDSFRRYVESNQIEGNYPSISDDRVRDYRMPVPPLGVQKKIVKALDQFAALQSELEAELKAELEARRAQYAQVRDALIDRFKASSVVLGKLGKITRGRRFTKADYVDTDGIPSIHYGEIYTRYGTSTSSAVQCVRSSLRKQLRFAQPGDVIFAGVGETVEDVGKAVAWLGDTPVAVHDDASYFASELDPTYVAYAVQTPEFHYQKSSLVARGKLKRLSPISLANIAIPVPPLVEQRRIVAFLDETTMSINDLTASLSAELVSRRKQYEYYRDKLLTFEEEGN